jgi:acyl-CoA hydrolase
MEKITSTYLVFPEDLNSSGTIFGGRIMSLMDLEAAKLSYLLISTSHADNVVTKAISNIDFIKPATKGDILEIEASLESFGTTSLTINVTVNKLLFQDRKDKICESKFIMVTLYKGEKTPHNLTKQS